MTSTAPQPFCVLGIDPGLTGAIAYYFPAHPNMISVEDLPVVDHCLDAATLAQRIEQMRPDLAIIESVGSRPGEGVASVFKFGDTCGAIRGVVAALKIPVHRVHSTKWKRHFRLSSDKEESRSRALELWPASAHFSRKRDHNRAEAALLARYGAEVVGINHQSSNS